MTTPTQLVHENIYYCISTLVSHLQQQEGFEDFYHLLSNTTESNYEEAALVEGWKECNTDELRTQCMMKHDITWEEALEVSHYNDDDFNLFDSWKELCNSEGLDSEPCEVREHWIVSDWLASKLEDKGESLEHDLHGLTVWGRCTSGQNISLDSVIVEICKDLS